MEVREVSRVLYLRTSSPEKKQLGNPSTQLETDQTYPEVADPTHCRDKPGQELDCPGGTPTESGSIETRLLLEIIRAGFDRKGGPARGRSLVDVLPTERLKKPIDYPSMTLGQ